MGQPPSHTPPSPSWPGCQVSVRMFKAGPVAQRVAAFHKLRLPVPRADCGQRGSCEEVAHGTDVKHDLFLKNRAGGTNTGLGEVGLSWAPPVTLAACQPHHHSLPSWEALAAPLTGYAESQTPSRTVTEVTQTSRPPARSPTSEPQERGLAAVWCLDADSCSARDPGADRPLCETMGFGEVSLTVHTHPWNAPPENAHLPGPAGGPS
ncbi:hypothetical protein AAFF_G00244380 [Aldrovandia affinis]|uniref:Uncharacterized protein n=1 Tax=Aldrovandia affinis TaxID=143900 RepID=A0AAD7RDE8_9TELE|nr:hypothetical protein AAFF_G00244380 [Aldrovandia affinis]